MSKRDYVVCPYCKYRGKTPTKKVDVYTCTNEKHPRKQIVNGLGVGASEQLLGIIHHKKLTVMYHVDYLGRLLEKDTLANDFVEALQLSGHYHWIFLKNRVLKWRKKREKQNG